MRKTISRAFLERLPAELYKIKLGGRGKPKVNAGGGTSYIPEKYDHFVVVHTRRGGVNDNFVRADDIHAIVGDRPTELDITLLWPSVEENFRSEMCEYSGQTKTRACDGHEMVDLRSGVTAPCQRKNGCKCKPYARFFCALDAAPRFGATAVFRTRGWRSTNNLQTTLEFFHSMFGTLMGLPLKLICYPSTDAYAEGGKTHQSTSHKVTLELRIGLREALSAARETVAMLAHHRRDIQLLSAGHEEAMATLEAEEAAEVAVEFFPDPSEAVSIATQANLEEMVLGLGLGVEPEEEEEGIPGDPPHWPAEDPSVPAERRALVDEVRGLMDLATEQNTFDADGATWVEQAIKDANWNAVERAAVRLRAMTGGVS